MGSVVLNWDIVRTAPPCLPGQEDRDPARTQRALLCWARWRLTAASAMQQLSQPNWECKQQEYGEGPMAVWSQECD